MYYVRWFGIMVLLADIATAKPVSEDLAQPSSPPEQAETCRLGTLSKNHTLGMPGCPDEVKALVDRAINCQHWVGEEPYDDARGHEIETAIAELKCDTLSLDHDRMLKHYAHQRDVMDALQAADREYNIEF